MLFGESMWKIIYEIYQNVVFIHSKTLEEAEFKLKMSKQMSKLSYKY